MVKFLRNAWRNAKRWLSISKKKSEGKISWEHEWGEMEHQPWDYTSRLYDIHEPKDVERLLKEVEHCLEELEITPDTPTFHKLPDAIQSALTEPASRQAFCEMACLVDAGKGQLIAIHRGFCELLHLRRAA